MAVIVSCLLRNTWSRMVLGLGLGFRVKGLGGFFSLGFYTRVYGVRAWDIGSGRLSFLHMGSLGV